MSLLMDALRRAEQEKKAAAKKLREKEFSLKDGWSDTNGLSLAPTDEDNEQQDIEQSSDVQGEESGEISHGIDPDSTIAEPRHNLELEPEDQTSIEPPGSRELEYESEVDTSGEHKSDSGMELSLKYEDRIDDDFYEEVTSERTANKDIVNNKTDEETQANENFVIDMSGEAGEQTLATDSDNANDTLILQNQDGSGQSTELPEYDQTLEQSKTYSETTERHSHTHQAQPEATGFSQLSAQNVFAARKQGSQTATTVIVLLLLIGIGLTAAGFFYYYSVTPATRQVISPRVTDNIASNRENSEPIELGSINAKTIDRPPQALSSIEKSSGTADTDRAESPIESVTMQLSAAALSEEISEVPSAEAGSETIAGSSAVTPSQQKNLSDTVSAEREASNPVSAEESADDDDPITSVTDSSVNLTEEEIELRPALVKISRSDTPTTVNEKISRAYDAYNKGNLTQARQLYQQVLDSSPNNRNALLGLGAIAVRQNQLDSAYSYYGKLLKQNPADSAAMAGLLSIQQQSKPASSVARIRRLLEGKPDAAYLYEALGHVYARTQRWPQAQQAYFDAFTRDSGNADYAFNLAVSLEQLNQSKAALEYYNKAIELGAEQPISFERSSAQERIEKIRQVISQ